VTDSDRGATVNPNLTVSSPEDAERPFRLRPRAICREALEKSPPRRRTHWRLLTVAGAVILAWTTIVRTTNLQTSSTARSSQAC